VLLQEGKLTYALFHSQCNVFVGNALVLVLDEKLTCAIFPSLCNVVVLVLQKKFPS